MEIQVTQTTLDQIRDLRTMFLKENNFQFICDKCHYYGWADTYLFKSGDQKIGYGSIWGTDKRTDRDTIFEFYLAEPYRKESSRIFSAFHGATNATLIECQSNDWLLTAMLYEFSENINAEAILFEDDHPTHLTIDGALLNKNSIEQDHPDDKQFVLEHNGETVATGGLMLNYNHPFADIYMGVKEGFAGKGYGSLIVQELKKVAYQIGRVPAARCNIGNHISKATLLKAGLRVCGFRLKGRIK